MMKNQLAGLMKQAQAMQDNMKRAQDELMQTPPSLPGGLHFDRERATAALRVIAAHVQRTRRAAMGRERPGGRRGRAAAAPEASRVAPARAVRWPSANRSAPLLSFALPSAAVAMPSCAFLSCTSVRVTFAHASSPLS